VSANKARSGFAARFVVTKLPTSDIATFYQEKLEENDWYYRKEEVVLSNRRVIFCGDDADDEAAVLVLPEKPVEKLYEYSLEISWNNSEGCH
jgi:hypothetical protein